MSVETLNIFQQLPHEILPEADADEASRQEFVKSFKQYIQSSILPGVKVAFDQRAAPAFQRQTGAAPDDRWKVREAMNGDA